MTKGVLWLSSVLFYDYNFTDTLISLLMAKVLNERRSVCHFDERCLLGSKTCITIHEGYTGNLEGTLFVRRNICEEVGGSCLAWSFGNHFLLYE